MLAAGEKQGWPAGGRKQRLPLTAAHRNLRACLCSSPADGKLLKHNGDYSPRARATHDKTHPFKCIFAFSVGPNPRWTKQRMVVGTSRLYTVTFSIQCLVIVVSCHLRAKKCFFGEIINLDYQATALEKGKEGEEGDAIRGAWKMLRISWAAVRFGVCLLHQSILNVLHSQSPTSPPARIRPSPPPPKSWLFQKNWSRVIEGPVQADSPQLLQILPPIQLALLLPLPRFW